MVKYDITKPLDYKDYLVLKSRLSYPTFSNGFIELIKSENEPLKEFVILKDCDAHREFFCYIWNNNFDESCLVKDTWVFNNICDFEDLKEGSIYSGFYKDKQIKYKCKEIQPLYYLFTLC